MAGDEQQVTEASGSESGARWRLEGVWWSVVGWGFVVEPFAACHYEKCSVFICHPKVYMCPGAITLNFFI